MRVGFVAFVLSSALFASSIQLAVAQQRTDLITTLEGTCDFSLPDLPPGPCLQSVMWMVLRSGRSALIFTYAKGNGQQATFALSGGTDRQPNLENYYLSIDRFRTFVDGKEINTDVEGECHFTLGAGHNDYKSVNCTIFNRRQGVMFKFNLNGIFAAETKASSDGAAAPTIMPGAGAPPNTEAQAQSGRPVTKAFTDCLLSEGKNGSYTSLDGGNSAIRLMGEACKAQWNAWQDQCIAEGGTDGGPGGCTMQAWMLAQSTLKLLGK